MNILKIIRENISAKNINKQTDTEDFLNVRRMSKEDLTSLFICLNSKHYKISTNEKFRKYVQPIKNYFFELLSE